jgi:hypothetical protein
MPMRQPPSLSLSLNACDSSRRHGERTNGHLATPVIEMLIGDWYVDELGIPTREITARN